MDIRALVYRSLAKAALPDNIDRMILYHLGKNARMSSSEIAENLHNVGFEITDRAVRQRLQRLEKSGVILGYSTMLNPQLISENRVSKTVLIKFRFSGNLQLLIDRLENYVQESVFCVYSARLNGDFDWICHFIFNSIEQFELENSNLLQRFADLISDYRVCDSKTIKVHPYSLFDEHEISEMKRQVNMVLNSLRKHDNLRDRLQATVESLVKYFNAKFARLWIVDDPRKNLLLKFSAGKYKNIYGEFSKVSINSTKIGQIARTKKPIITNDVVNDPRIKYPEWAKRENLQSFAGYPLSHKGQIIGVVGMFSEKKLSPVQFEMLGIFCDHISKEITMLYDIGEFLSIR
jgi:DNA-binding Lrp family transcriptional regulator